MKKIIYILCWSISIGIVYGQIPQYTIKGEVKDAKSGLPFANVLVLQAKDSTLLKASTSDADGKFLIDINKEGNYILQVSMVGFNTHYSDAFLLNAEQKQEVFSPIILSENIQKLDEVTVSSQKLFIEQKVDKTIVNVENSIVASGNTALEVLEKAPGVVVDQQNDQIKLKNKTGVQIMIDGKKSYLSEKDITQLLRNMSSDQVASIEIITNPSAKYDASGNSGIINIKLKKNQNLGTNGTLSLTTGYAFIPHSVNDLYRGSTNLTINHRASKWNLYGTISGNRGSWYNDNTLYRTVNYEGEKSTFDQFSYRSGNGLFASTKIGIDYFVSDKTTIGIMVDGNNWDGTMKGSNNTHISNTILSTSNSNSLIQNSDFNSNEHNITTNFNIKHNFNDKGKEITIDLDYSRYGSPTLQNFYTNYYNDTDSLTNQITQRNSTPTFIDIYAVKSDFTLPINDKIKLEMGAKIGYVQTDNDFIFEKLVGTSYQNDPTKTNHFIYEENVNAAYFNFSWTGKVWGIQTGLRLEHTNSSGHSVTLNTTVYRNYLSPFPSIFVNQNINDNHALRYSYSRRIDRPNYQQLNPFIFFLDPYTYEEGNPYLQPQFTDNLEVSYTYKGAATLSLGYARTTDNMVQIIEQDDSAKITKAIQRNIESFHNYSVNVSFPIPIAKWLMMQNNIALYYNQYQDPNLLGGTLNLGQFAYDFNTSLNFTIPKGWGTEVSMWYNSPNVYGNTKSLKPQYAVNIGIQKEFKKIHSKLKLNVSDIFLTSFWKGAVNYQNIDLQISGRWTSRRISLTFTYNFGNQNVKAARNRQTATDAEKSRIGNKN